MSPTSSEARVLGDFVLGGMLGEGGFGTVYRAHQTSLDRAAVIKTMRGSLAHRPEAKARFLQEAKLASRFDHPYAAHIYAFGAESDGLLWIAMELVRGTPLDELLRSSGPLPLERFLTLMERLCDVVQAAHEQGIVHRDIKPSNVMVIARAGRLMPKLLDFGIAKAVRPDIQAKPLQARAKRASNAAGKVPEATPAELDRTVPAQSTVGASSASSGLTHAGQVLGSPTYMAPEQWLDATTVGPWTDQYALGIVAFELLTGKRPFDATSMHELAAQHVYDSLPALPRALPAALHAALAKATAKDPAQRYPDVAALATALRAACALPAEIEDRIELPTELFASWSSDAPRPLAEALAAVAAARSPVRVADRAQAAAQVLAHWIGVLALAARSRLGALGGDDDASLIRELRRRPLRPLEWLDLAAVLTKPYGERAEMFPIPELVGMFGGAALEPLRALLASQQGLLVLDGLSTVEQQTARARVAQLSSALTACSWLLDYELARTTAAGLELWMGQPGDELVTRPAQGDAVGRIVLLDGDGVRVAALSPLVHIGTPAPGQPEQVFAFAGPGRSPGTARLTALPGGFDHDVDDVWSWLAEHVLDVAAAGDDTADDDRGPYPGLAPFTAKDAGSYVGRERDVEELVNRLRRDAIVAVVGPSGAGKSSFLAAGVLPALPAGWQAEMLRPGDDPIAALVEIAHTFDGSPYRGSVMRTESIDSPAQVAAALIERARQTTLVIAIDQAEELFTMCRDAARREAFADVLLQATRASNVRVIVGVRDDFFVRADELVAWRGMLANSVQILRPPGAPELERIVREPMKRRGYDFEDATLPHAIAQELAGRPGALPLVAFAGAELWERRDRHFHRIPRAAYEEIGGVQGAIVRHADGVVDALPVDDRRLVRLAFRRLLSPEGTRVLVERADLISALGGDAAATRVIERLLAARLLVTRDDDTSAGRVEIVHEALTTTWPRLAQWRREGSADLRLYQQLATAAKAWDERGRAPGLLWAGDALAELRAWRERTELRMTVVEGGFADASETAHRRSRRRRFGALAGALGVLTTGVVLLAGMNRIVSHQKTEAVQRLAASLQEHGRVAIEGDDPGRALVYFAAAKKLGANNAGLDLLVSRAAQAIESEHTLVLDTKRPIHVARYDAATLVLVGPDRIASVWDRASRAQIAAPIKNIGDAVVAGDSLAWLTLSGQAIVTDRAGATRWSTQAMERTTAAEYMMVPSLAATPAFVAVAQKVVRLYHTANGEAAGEIASAAAISAMAFDPAGTRLAVGDLAGNVSLWDVASRARLAVCAGHTGAIASLAFSSDGALLASGGVDRDIVLCTATGELVKRFEGHSNAVDVLEISPDHKRVLSASADGTARVWDVATGTADAVLARHHGTITAAHFSPDGTLVATSSADGTVRLWDPTVGTQLGLMQGAGATTTVAWDPGGRLVWTTSSDGTVREWDVARALRGELWPQDSREDVSISADGTREVAGGETAATIRDLVHGRQIAAMPMQGPMSAQMREDGARAITADASGQAMVWTADGAAVHSLAMTGAVSVAFAGKNEIAANDHAVAIWDEAGRPIATTEVGFMSREIDVVGDTVLAISLSQGADIVKIAVLDTRGTLRATLDGSVYAIDPIHHELATCVGPRVHIYDMASWHILHDFSAHEGVCTSITYAGGHFVSGGSDRTLRVWTDAGAAVASIASGSTPLALATPDDGATFISGGQDGSLRVWDATSLRELDSATVSSAFAWKLAVSRDGHVVAATSDGHVARWTIQRASRSLADLESLVRCRVPLSLVGDDVVPRAIDFADPACRR